MLTLDRTKSCKWIFQKNVSSKDVITCYLDVVNNVHFIDDRSQIMYKLKQQGIYRGRSSAGSLNTMGVRFSQMCFYMFGSKKDNSFIPSQMTLNILENEKYLAENMLVNLFSLQYPNPYSKTPACFKLYVGRLITKLLTEPKLGRKLYIDEFIWFLPFIKKINQADYDNLVDSILEYRLLDYYQKKDLFESVDNYDELFSNCMHECKYYFMRIFAEFGVFEFISDFSHNDGQLFRFKHGNPKTSTTFRTDVIEGSSVSGYIRFNPNIIDSAEKLISAYCPFDAPSTMADNDVYSKDEWITSLYDVEPLKYLSIVIPTYSSKSNIISTLSKMEYSARYGSVDGKEFERALKPVFELFDRVINAEIISGSGDTDILCTIDSCESNFNNAPYNINIDGKSRSSSLNTNVKRLVRHLEIHSSKYCIVVAPRFVKGTIEDMRGEKVVALRADLLAKYCSKECMSNNNELARFTPIENIILSNLGKDISSLVDGFIKENYGIDISPVA